MGRKNAAGHDFDLMDVRENLDDGFTDFGKGSAARSATLLYLTHPRGMSKFDLLFNPRSQVL